jgi:hypothetical protein
MDPRLIPLYYLSSFAGLVMVVGGIWLIYKEKIYIDRESKQVTEIETPVGKFKTNAPALALFLLGFVPLIYPILGTERFAEEVSIHGNIRSTTHPVVVYAVGDIDSLSRDGEFRLQVPFVKNGEEYRVLYLAQGRLIVDEERGPLRSAKGGEIEIPSKEITLPASAEVRYQPGAIAPVPPEFQ